MSRPRDDQPVQYVKGIGPKRAKILERLGIRTLRDALYYLPYRYEDRRSIKPIASLKPEGYCTVQGSIAGKDLIDTRRGMKILELLINDGTGLLKAKWFNQAYLGRQFKVGDRVVLSGVVRRDYRWGVGLEMHNPDYEILKDIDQSDNIHTARIVPFYSVTEGVSQRAVRSMMFSIVTAALQAYEDYMPVDILAKAKLPDLKTAFLNLHFPEGDIDISLLNEFKTPYHQRLAFDEFLFLQAGLLSLKMGRRRERGISFRNDNALIRKLAKALPFKLTNAQRRVVGEILRDMESPEPMNRLIQGDVGSGKTVVALMAMLKAVDSGYQAALMAPTEILAEQHYNNIKRYLEGLGVTAALLTGSSKNRPYEGIKNGEIKIIVGTHALIQEGVEFGNLGLVVIDEQHRFGVLQRAGLRKKGQNPDVLVMTATPIPRTMALTLYGDLEYSLIDELPPGRKPVRTMLFLESEKKRIYEIIHSEIKKGHQAYIVYPAIEESEKLNLRSAVPAREALEKIFPRYRIGLIHGRMKQEERDQIMKAFKEGDIDILVSTTVVEVGVDVPNATVMLVVHAERFGLSQLHQLRGRVGRGEDQAWCLLLAYGRLTDEAVRRLEVMVKYSDGFRIAEEDFKIRGPGELFGTRQSGLPDFRVADLFRDAPLLQRARSEAERLIEDDPLLSGYPLLRAEVERFWKGKMEIFRTS